MTLEATCTGVTLVRWEQLMKGATRACKKTIDRLIKQHLPDLYEELRLDLRNPYRYWKTKTHLVMVHSGIEYFLRFEE